MLSFTNPSRNSSADVRIPRTIAWKLFLTCSIGLTAFALNFHRHGWDIFLEKPGRASQLPLAIVMIACTAGWVLTLVALLFGKRVPKCEARPQAPPSANDDRWLE